MEFKVRPLFDLAFKALFEEIFCHLQYCHEQNKIENLIATLVVDDFPGVISLQQQVSNIREKLDPYLIGPFSEIRKKFIVEFTKSHLCKNLHQVDPDICLAFFDCLLDDSFKKCDASTHDVSSSFPDLNNFLEVLALRSPKLESVMVRSDDDTEMTPEMGQSSVLLLKKFTHLTSITIKWTAPYDCLNFFSNLSDSCPKLSKLDLGKFCFHIPQLFALMFGSKYYQLPRVLQPQYLASWSSGALHQLEFQQDNLTSISSSLKEFGCKNFCDVVENKSKFWADPSAIAFFLRHFRNIQKLSHTCRIYQCEPQICSGVAKLLEESAKEESELTSMSFSSHSIGVIHLTNNAPFRGHLNLVELEGIDIRSRKIMLMVQLLCPNLKSIRFRQNNPTDDADQSDDLILIGELQSMLAVESNCWSKISVVKFDDVSAEYRQAVLSVIGSQLLVLYFFNCDDIDVATELFPCTKLEDLFINASSTVASIATEQPIPFERFLPDLKILFLTSCSPDLFRLFESPRKSLQKITCNCIHFGIRGASSYHWSDVPHLWPNLEMLKIDSNSRSFSIEGLRQMRSAIRKLTNLIDLYLPEDLEELGSEEVKEFIKELETELKSFQPNFVFFCSSQGGDTNCYLNIVELVMLTFEAARLCSCLIVQLLCPNLKSSRYRQNDPTEVANQ